MSVDLRKMSNRDLDDLNERTKAWKSRLDPKPETPEPLDLLRTGDMVDRIGNSDSISSGYSDLPEQLPLL
jgi:hypothetical protein